MPRHRLLPHEELEAEAVELLLQLVDPVVVQDDGVGEAPFWVTRALRLAASARSAIVPISATLVRMSSMPLRRFSSR